MFRTDSSHLPAGILLYVFSLESFDLSDYQRLACVSKEWCSVTYCVNRSRKLSFLPPVDNQSHPLPATTQLPTVAATIALEHLDTWGQKPL
jgi:hypothetical protein